MYEPLILKEYTSYSKEENEDVYKRCLKVYDYLSEDSSGLIYLNGKYEKGPNILKYDRNKESIMVNSYVGIINVTIQEDDGSLRNQIVNIGSRFDSGEEQYFLNYIFSKILDIKDRVFEDMDPKAGISTNWHILLLMVFIKYLEETKGKGLYRKYQTFEYNDPKLKGKIDVDRHIKDNILGNGRVAYSTREYTIHNSINYLILLANDQLEKKYSRIYKNIINNRPEARKIINELKSKIPNYKSADARKVLKETSKPITHPYYNIFENLRKASIMILRGLGYNIFQDTGLKVVGIVVDMANLWEDFLDEVIFKDLQFKDKSYKTTDQDEKGILGSPDIGREKEFKRIIKPDFTIYSINKDGKEEYEAVFDAKYRDSWGKNLFKNNARDKENWDSGVRNDVFQIMAYMLALDCSVGGSIFPVNKDRELEKNLFGKYSISDYCKDRFFYTIPYLIPEYEKTKDMKVSLSYEEFTNQMEEQNKAIREEVINILGKD